jgi:hypothetical protein
MFYFGIYENNARRTAFQSSHTVSKNHTPRDSNGTTLLLTPTCTRRPCPPRPFPRRIDPPSRNLPPRAPTRSSRLFSRISDRARCCQRRTQPRRAPRRACRAASWASYAGDDAAVPRQGFMYFWGLPRMFAERLDGSGGGGGVSLTELGPGCLSVLGGFAGGFAGLG